MRAGLCIGIAILFSVLCVACDKSIACVDESTCPGNDLVCNTVQGQCAAVNTCGNGIWEEAAGEDCDDGTVEGDDGCDNCNVEPGWICSSDPGQPSDCFPDLEK
jgi:cysteine-rich repeat protein